MRMKKFYLLSLFLIGMGLVAPAFSANAQVTDGEAAEEPVVTTMTVDPVPGNRDEGLPRVVTVTFSAPISELETLKYRSDNGIGDFDADSYSWNDDKTALTINIAEEIVSGSEGLVVTVEAKDANGAYAQYKGNEIAIFKYKTTLPSNTFECMGTNPSDQMILAKLDKFELTYYNPADDYGEDYIGGLDGNKKIVVLDANEQVMATAINFEIKKSDEWSETKNVLAFTLDRTIEDAGEYKLVIPEGMVYNSGYDAAESDFGVENLGAIFNAEQFYVFTVSPVKVDKAPGEYEGGLPETITLTFPQEVDSVESAYLTTLYSFDGANLLDVEGACVVEGNTVTLNIPAELLAGNEYAEVMLQVVGVDGVYYAYNSYGDGVNLVYTTDLPDDRFACVPTPSPDEVQEELSVIELAFVNPATAEEYIGNDLETPTLDVLDENGVVITTAQLSIKEGDDLYNPFTNVVVAKLKNKIRGLGKYSITIPEKLVYNSFYNPWVEDRGVSEGAIYNAETTLVYTIAEPDGIESVNAANAKATIYNVAGQKLRETNVNNLGRGVYIVNGKKVVVK